MPAHWQPVVVLIRIRLAPPSPPPRRRRPAIPSRSGSSRRAAAAAVRRDDAADELRALVPDDLVLAGQVHIMRGRALHDSGVDRKGGIAMVRAGRDEFARSPLARPGDLDPTDAWLADKP